MRISGFGVLLVLLLIPGTVLSGCGNDEPNEADRPTIELATDGDNLQRGPWAITVRGTLKGLVDPGYVVTVDGLLSLPLVPQFEVTRVYRTTGRKSVTIEVWEFGTRETGKPIVKVEATVDLGAEDPGIRTRLKGRLRQAQGNGLFDALEQVAAKPGFDVLPELRAILKSSSSAQAKTQCIRLIERLAAVEAWPDLVEALGDDQLAPHAWAALHHISGSLGVSDYMGTETGDGLEAARQAWRTFFLKNEAGLRKTLGQT